MKLFIALFIAALVLAPLAGQAARNEGDEVTRKSTKPATGEASIPTTVPDAQLTAPPMFKDAGAIASFIGYNCMNGNCPDPKMPTGSDPCGVAMPDATCMRPDGSSAPPAAAPTSAAGTAE